MIQQHNRLNHLSIIKVQGLARIGTLPKRWADTQISICPSCQFGKATKRPWRTEAKPGKLQNLRKIEYPRDCVSVDQLESPIKGFTEQIKGRLTTKQYKVLPIFADHLSDLGFIYLQQSTNAEETLMAKKFFETYARGYSVKVRHYHTSNGRLAENAFMTAIPEEGQTISFCGVGAHYQNDKAEKRIWDLQERAGTSILHAKSKWPQAIDTSFWRYAIRLCNEVFNNLGRRREAPKTPFKNFSNTNVPPRPDDFHHFGCPTYVLMDPLQSGKSAGKWNPRSRLGICLGMSPKYAWTMASF